MDNDILHSTTLNLTNPPKRIISVVPSQTELLHDLGLDEEVIGITKFCIHPDVWFRNKTRVGGTKTLDLQKVKALLPDLTLANKEENVKEQIEELSATAPVYVSDIKNLNDALEMIRQISRLVNKDEKGIKIARRINHSFNELQTITFRNIKVKTAYLIWKDPYMAAGGDTFINDLIDRCGLKNIFSELTRYPEVTVSQLSQLGCEVLLLSSEPYPFKQKHIDELQQQLGGIKILLVDGEMFSWYGSRLLYAAEYFKKLLEKIHR